MAAGQDPIVWVTAAIPRPLMAALQQRGGVPHQVRLEVDRQLRAGVQPQVIRDRLERRWFLRYSNLTGRDLLERADGIALEIVEPPACPAQRCEDGQLLDDSGSCPVCRPNGTTVNFTGSDRGERATPAAYQRAAAGIRSRLREGHRSLQAAEERARASRRRSVRVLVREVVVGVAMRSPLVRPGGPGGGDHGAVADPVRARARFRTGSPQTGVYGRHATGRGSSVGPTRMIRTWRLGRRVVR
jgi:hypothetical protein